MTAQSKQLKLVRYLSYDHGGEWAKYDDDDELFVQGIPKVELHVHLDGSFDPDYLYQYLQEHPDDIYCLPVEQALPWDDSKKLKVREMVQNCNSAADYHKLCTCRGYRSLKEMLNCFEIFLPLVRKNLQLIETLAFDFVERQYQQNVVYTEVRYSPFLLAQDYNETSSSDADAPSVSGQDVYDAVTRGLRKGCSKYGIVVNQILSAITWTPEWATPTLELVQKHRHDYPCAAVGVDIASGEEHFDKDVHGHLHQPHYDMIQRAKELGVPITLHAGEVPEGRHNIRRAIHEYGASRIGHGYRVVDDSQVLQLVKESNVHFEVCPTSSDETGGWMYEKRQWHEHPAVEMVNQGLKVSFSSDDPAVFHTSLSWQYRIGLVKMGLTRQHLFESNLAGINAAFCDEETKSTVREALFSFGNSKKLKIDFDAVLSDHLRGKMQKRWSVSSMSESFLDRVYVSRSGSVTEYL